MHLESYYTCYACICSITAAVSIHLQRQAHTYDHISGNLKMKDLQGMLDQNGLMEKENYAMT